MRTEIKLCPNEEGRGVIQLTVPASITMKVAEAVRGLLMLSGHKVRRVNDSGDEWVTAEEVFPDGCPAMALRGLRSREGITQAEMATRVGVSQNAISEMESGKRPISVNMAKRLSKEFDIPLQSLFIDKAQWVMDVFIITFLRQLQ